jgi:hypothetical protein
MTPRGPCPALPGPLEEYAGHFDNLFGHKAQRQSFRAYIQGPLLPRSEHGIRNQAYSGAQDAAVQQLQSFV